MKLRIVRQATSQEAWEVAHPRHFA